MALTFCWPSTNKIIGTQKPTQTHIAFFMTCPKGIGSHHKIETGNIAVYIRKQELCQEMAENAHVPITEDTTVTTGTKHAVATGGMDDALRIWMRLPNDQQTWVQWKTMLSGAFLENRSFSSSQVSPTMAWKTRQRRWRWETRW